MDSEAVCQHLFTSVLADLFPNPMLAFEFAQFCRDSLHLFNPDQGTFKLSFPNLFKVCEAAWVGAPVSSGCAWGRRPGKGSRGASLSRTTSTAIEGLAGSRGGRIFT